MPTPPDINANDSFKTWRLNHNLQNAELTDKIGKLEFASIVGNIEDAILDIPLKSNLSYELGSGYITTDRASTASYVNKYGIVKTVVNDIPRFEKQGLLIEEGSTNICLQSESFNTTWITDGLIVIANNSNAPDNNLTSDNLGTPTGNKSISLDTTIDGNNKTYTASVWMKGFGNVNLLLGTIGNTFGNNVITLSSEWTRYNLTHTMDAIAANVEIKITLLTATSIDVWGAQVEEKSFMTSYISTTNTSNNRLADNISITYENNIPVANSEMTIICDVSKQSIDNTNDSTILNIAGEAARAIQINNTTQVISCLYGTSPMVSTSSINTIKSRVSLVNDNVDSKVYFNGLEEATQVSEIVTGSLTNIELGRNNNTNYLNGHISMLKIYDVALNANEILLS